MNDFDLPQNGPDAFCKRDASGRVIAVMYTDSTGAVGLSDGWDAVPATDHDVEAFVQGSSDRISQLSQSDAGFIRILEDLIEVLIRKRLILLTDLPESAQVKLLLRFATRDGADTQNEIVLDGSENQPS